MRLLVLSSISPDLSAGSFRASTWSTHCSSLPAGAAVGVITTAPNRATRTPRNSCKSRRRTADDQAHCAAGTSQRPVGTVRAFLHFARCANSHTANIPYDIVFATSSRLMTATLGAWIARRAGARLYLDIRDIFVDTIGDIFRRIGGVLRGTLSALERWTMRRADRINLVSRGFEDYFRSRYPDRSYSWFTNGIDEEFLRADWSTHRVRDAQQPLRVVYAGNIGEGQGLQSILPQLALRLGRRVHFCVIGDGGRRELLLDLLRQSGVQNVEVLPPISRPALLEAYADADILFLHLNAHAAFEKVLPSKIFEYAATGKPIWAGVPGSAAPFIAAALPNAAVFAPCDVSQAIEKLDGLILQDEPRRNFTERYARRNIAKAMADDILKLARAHSP